MRSRGWPTVTATVVSADCPLTTTGCTVATVYYEYVVQWREVWGYISKAFISQESGKDYAAQFVKGIPFKVRVKPDDSTKSVPL